MYSKEEVKQLKTDFWTSFGKYMKKHNSTYINKVNWVNYNTKVKDVYFRLAINKKRADFAIELQHKDTGIRKLFFEQFTELKTLINDSFETELLWEEETFNEFGFEISKISCYIEKISIYNKDTWKEIFTFFDKNLISVHEFWLDFNEIFKQLED
jgi:hypothetical protein